MGERQAYQPPVLYGKTWVDDTGGNSNWTATQCDGVPMFLDVFRNH